MKTNFSTFNYKNEEWTLTPPSTTTATQLLKTNEQEIKGRREKYRSRFSRLNKIRTCPSSFPE
jgi:hypothetical protein